MVCDCRIINLCFGFSFLRSQTDIIKDAIKQLHSKYWSKIMCDKIKQVILLERINYFLLFCSRAACKTTPNLIITITIKLLIKIQFLEILKSPFYGGGGWCEVIHGLHGKLLGEEGRQQAAPSLARYGVMGSHATAVQLAVLARIVDHLNLTLLGCLCCCYCYG